MMTEDYSTSLERVARFLQMYRPTPDMGYPDRIMLLNKGTEWEAELRHSDLVGLIVTLNAKTNNAHAIGPIDDPRTADRRAAIVAAASMYANYPVRVQEMWVTETAARFLEWIRAELPKSE